MAISLPITSELGDAEPDVRHYTSWTQKRAPVVVAATPENPAPEDPGIVETEDRHFTEWTAKPRP